MCCVRLRLACVAVLGWGVGFLLCPASGWAQNMAPMVFDKPVKTETATFMEYDPPGQADPSRPKLKVTVTCSYYPHFVVEVVHFDGDEGSNIFTAPVEKGSVHRCEDPEVSNPKAVGDAGGGLVGVKNDLVVTAGPDTIDDGTGFSIFRALDHKLVLLDAAQVNDNNWPLITSIKESNAGVEVRYNRIFVGSCSVAGHGKACVDRFVKQTGVGKPSFALCETKYRLLKGVEGDLNEDATAIAYGVKVFIPSGAPPVDLNLSSASLSTGKDHGQAMAQLTTEGRLTGCFPAE